ncbi:MAG: AAA family ATPase [Desulfuromonadia bacterium]
MARKIFVGATGQHCGKTTLSLSLMHLARKRYERVAFIKPVGPKLERFGTIDVDMDAILMARAYGLDHEIETMCPVPLYRNFTREYLAGRIDPASLERRIMGAMEYLESAYDFIIVEGAGHCGVGSVIGLSNARVAKMINAPVLIVTDSGIGRSIDAVHLNLALYRAEGADVRGVVMNKLLADKRQRVLTILEKAFRPEGLSVIGGFNYSPILANPTLAHIGKLLGLPVNGDPEGRSRIIHTIQLGAASSQRVVDSLLPSSLMVLTSSRDELIVTLSSLYHIPAYRERIVGLVVAGHANVSPITQQILDQSGIPYIRVFETTAEVFTKLMDDVAKITADDQEKLHWIQSNAEHDIDFDRIDRLIS